MPTTEAKSRLSIALAVAVASGALLLHARAYDFVCDDAFITFRFASNLAETGHPVYNVGEQVEGYTSPLFMALLALAALAGAPLPIAAQALGALGSIALLAASRALVVRLAGRRPWTIAFVLASIAVAAPVAAWTLGGLETTFFAFFVVAALLLVPDLLDRRLSARRAAAFGLVLALGVLARPEGALVAAWALVVPLVASRGASWRSVLAAGLAAGVLIGTHETFRWTYYGWPLPNTFYLKASGEAAALAERGLAYLGLAARELGIPHVALLVVGCALPADDGPKRRALAWAIRGLLVSYVAYLVRVGGDFLDLYRFLVPVWSPAVALAVVGWVRTLDRVGASWRPALRATAAATLAVVVLATFAWGQRRLATVATDVAPDDARRELGVEPLGWTRLYARRWAAMGRWIASAAEPDDWMAVGAAGAMPYYAGIRNLDTFGLCDAWVAHEGPVIGNRPGHQRFAPHGYILARNPVFLLIGNDFTRDGPRRPDPPRDLGWERQGYVWVAADLEPDVHGSPTSFSHYLLVRRDRALALSGRPHVRIARVTE